jgi:DNA helicase HerA-like ATPase
VEKRGQVVKLIRSKGIGVYFVTQNPRDIPDGVLAQLGNKVQHALHAYTPSDQKAVKAAADSFRENPAFKTADVIEALGTGEAVVSFLQEDGTPAVVEQVDILPPQSQMGGISDSERDATIKASLLYSKYANGYDAESAFELLARMGVEKAEAEAKAKADAEAAKAAAKEQAAAEKAAAKEAEKEANRRKRAAKSVGTTVAGTVGREVGKKVGKQLGGKFGQTLGGNTGAQLLRGLLNTLIK